MEKGTKIQYYNSAKDNSGREFTIGEAIDIISTGKLKVKIETLRGHKSGLETLKGFLAEAKTDEDKKKWTSQIKLREKYIDNTKKGLPSVTFGGTFAAAICINSKSKGAFLKGKLNWKDAFDNGLTIDRTRAAEQLKDYSGLMTIDVDKLPSDKINKLKIELKKDPYTAILFTSPSGNGLKVIVKVEGGPEMHTQNFIGLEYYYHKKYGIDIDKSGKDVSRLCFLSYDPNLLCNYNSEIFKLDKNIFTPGKKEVSYKSPTFDEKQSNVFSNGMDSLDWVKKWLDKSDTYQEGNRNQYIFKFSCFANRKGIDLNDTLNYVLSFASDMDLDEVSETIRKAYEYNKYEHGSYKKVVISKPKNNPGSKQKKANNDTSGNNNGSGNQNDNGSNNNRGGGDDGNTGNNGNGRNDNGNPESGFIQFWWEQKDEQRKDENGEPLLKYHLKYNEFIDFLANAGFYRLPLKDGFYQFIHYNDNICKPVSGLHMKDYVFDWLEDRYSKESDYAYKRVLEMMRRGAKSYFIPQVLEGLPYKTIQFKRDTADEAFFYFKNCFVKVTEKSISTHHYKELQGAIWGSSIIDKEFTLNGSIDYTLENGTDKDADEMLKCEWYYFLRCVSHNPNNSPVNLSDEAMKLHNREVFQKYKSMTTALGYLLHGFKTPSMAKAIIAVDHKDGEKGEQNGGTGKSIVGNYALKAMKKVTQISGKEYKDENQWRFEPVTIDTQILFFNDVRYNFNFESIFELITDDMVINRRNIGYLYIPFSESPKIYLTTNFVLKGEGSSFKRRIHIIEFDDFFNENHSPYDEFGHNLFTDWDNDQWQRFFNFMLQAVQWYMRDGLIDFPGANYETRKLKAECPIEFIDWMDSDRIPRNQRIEKKYLMEEWAKSSAPLGLNKCTSNQFSKWVKKYCQNKGLNLNPQKKGARDTSNGVEYYTLGNNKIDLNNIPDFQTPGLFERIGK